MKLDVTGNFTEGRFLPYISVGEPDIFDTETKRFFLSLRVRKKSGYKLTLVYNVLLDRRPLRTINGSPNGFKGLTADGKQYILAFRKISENIYEATADFTAESDIAFIAVDIVNTRPL